MTSSSVDRFDPGDWVFVPSVMESARVMMITTDGNLWVIYKDGSEDTYDPKDVRLLTEIEREAESAQW